MGGMQGKKRNSYILVEKTEGNNKLGKPKHINEDDTKIDIKNRMEGRRLD
jgi:hypothetical protein